MVPRPWRSASKPEPGEFLRRQAGVEAQVDVHGRHRREWTVDCAADSVGERDSAPSPCGQAAMPRRRQRGAPSSLPSAAGRGPRGPARWPPCAFTSSSSRTPANKLRRARPARRTARLRRRLDRQHALGAGAVHRARDPRRAVAPHPARARGDQPLRAAPAEDRELAADAQRVRARPRQYRHRRRRRHDHRHGPEAEAHQQLPAHGARRARVRGAAAPGRRRQADELRRARCYQVARLCADLGHRPRRRSSTSPPTSRRCSGSPGRSPTA